MNRFDSYIYRYKKLSRNTWGVWGEWSGSPIQGCETILRDLGIEPGQFQMGKTKIFIRHPETVYLLEDSTISFQNYPQ